MESDHIHNPSTIRASVVPNNPYFENNGSLQIWEIYGFGGNMEINIHQILVIWGCGDSYGQGSGWSPGFVSPLVVHCTTNLPPRSWRLSRIVERRPVPSWFLDIQGEHSVRQKLRFKDNWYWIGNCFDLSLSNLLISGIRYMYQV